jgi:hypothetical protein
VQPRLGHALVLRVASQIAYDPQAPPKVPRNITMGWHTGAAALPSGLRVSVVGRTPALEAPTGRGRANSLLAHQIQPLPGRHCNCCSWRRK